MRFFIRLIAIISVATLTGCGNKYVYNDCRDIDEDGWSADSIATFTPQISDTTGRYDILLTIRHTSGYEYQNFWTFVKVTSPDGLTATDTIECYLTDNKGHFLGSGISIYEMPVLISRNIRFEKEGEYKFEILQGMRDWKLKGIRNICLSLERK